MGIGMSEVGERVRLTALSHGAGCACKLSLDELTGVLAGVGFAEHDDLVVGAATGDDAAVWRQPDGRVLVATTDFFTPLVDDPATWGRIAAANAVSDVYAMGATPRFALNLVGWPRALPFELLQEVLTGATAVAAEAGYPLVGGHSIDSAEPLYGQVVIGDALEERLLTNAGARRAGDRADEAAGDGDRHDGAEALPARGCRGRRGGRRRLPGGGGVDDPAQRVASQVAFDAGATAATDVTGFGLLGHLHRLAAASGVACAVDPAAVPLLPEVERSSTPGSSQAAPSATWSSRRGSSDAEADERQLDPAVRCADLGGLVFTCDP
jgi:selenide, water dikinase